MSDLQRITTVYNETEDRLQLTGEIASGEVLEFWLSQRLMLRLLPLLFEWLEQQIPTAALQVSIDPKSAGLMQDFAQHAAHASLQVEEPVRNKPGASSWLVNSIDIAKNNQVLTLQFKNIEGATASLGLQPQQLRQWLAIVQQQWLKAQWPQGIWPQWMSSTGTAPQVESGNISFH